MPHTLLLFLYTDSFWCIFWCVPPLVSASVATNEAKAIPPLFFVYQVNCVFHQISFSKYLLPCFTFPFIYLPRRSTPHMPEVDFKTSDLLPLFCCFHFIPSLFFLEWYCSIFCSIACKLFSIFIFSTSCFIYNPSLRQQPPNNFLYLPDKKSETECISISCWRVWAAKLLSNFLLKDSNRIFESILFVRTSILFLLESIKGKLRTWIICLVSWSCKYKWHIQPTEIVSSYWVWVWPWVFNSVSNAYICIVCNTGLG